MSKHLRFGLAAFALTACAATGVLARDQPVFKAASDLVRVFVTVTSGEGRLVTGLGREAFEVRDDDNARPIDVFDDSPVPIRLVILLDVSGSMSGNIQLVRHAAEELLLHLNSDDLAQVGFFGEVITFSGTFTRDAGALRAALPDDDDAKGITPLWIATGAALRRFTEPAVDHRRVILILSDGKNDLGRNAAGGLTADDVIEHAWRSDAMIYSIGLRSRLSNRYVTPGSFRTSLEDDLPDPALARVAAETGGGYVEINRRDDLAAAFVGVIAELHSQYLLGFSSSAHDGKVHRLQVRVRGRGMKARARNTYVAPVSEPH